MLGLVLCIYNFVLWDVDLEGLEIYGYLLLYSVVEIRYKRSIYNNSLFLKFYRLIGIVLRCVIKKWCY